MSHGQRLVLSILGLGAFVALARYGILRQERIAAAQKDSRYDAMRRARSSPSAEPRLEAPPPRPVEGRRGPLPPIPVRFTEMGPAATGVEFVHTFGGGAMDNLVKSVGGGVTLFDFDGDGDLDLYFAQGNYDPVAAAGEAPPEPPVNRLYRNDGGWRFTDVTRASGLGDPGYSTGGAAADFDGDGDQDLFVANYGRSRLYRNEGGGRFIDATDAAGIRCDGFAVGGAWGDADGDGRLDLLVCMYMVFDPAVKASSPEEPFPGPLAYRGESCRLFRRKADGTFEDATQALRMWSTEGRGMGVAFADLDGDGRDEILVANDATPNFVYERRGPVFVETGLPWGFAYSALGEARSSMGVTVLDADRDRRPDVVVPDGTGGAFYRHLGRRFEDQASLSGMRAATGNRVGWSAAPLDFDLDGWPDLAISCGALHALEPQRPLLLRNLGEGRFEDVSKATSFGRECMGRGAAAGDLDGDGDPDLVIATLGARPLLLRNEGGEARASLRVRCSGKGPNRDALGAEVEVEADGLVQREWVRTTQGYLAGSGPELLFGLGRARKADAVRVKFPSGTVREVRDVPRGRIEIVE